MYENAFNKIEQDLRAEAGIANARKTFIKLQETLYRS